MKIENRFPGQFSKTEFDGILVITFNYVEPGTVYSHIKFQTVGTLFVWLLSRLCKSFTPPFPSFFAPFLQMTLLITHPPHSLISLTSLNQHKITSLTFSETQPLYQTPVVLFIS